MVEYTEVILDSSVKQLGQLFDETTAKGVWSNRDRTQLYLASLFAAKDTKLEQLQGTSQNKDKSGTAGSSLEAQLYNTTQRIEALKAAKKEYDERVKLIGTDKISEAEKKTGSGYATEISDLETKKYTLEQANKNAADQYIIYRLLAHEVVPNIIALNPYYAPNAEGHLGKEWSTTVPTKDNAYKNLADDGSLTITIRDAIGEPNFSFALEVFKSLDRRHSRKSSS